MNRFPRFALVVLPLVLLTTAAQAVPPIPAKPTEITLAANPLERPIGIEPQGGRFQSLLAERAKPGDTAEAKFSTDSSRQNKSTLAIFASDTAFVHDEKPLARVEIAGLGGGGQKDRVRVKMTKVSAKKLSVEAWDIASGRPLAVRQVTADELQQIKFAADRQPGVIVSTKVRPPAPIASRDGRNPAPIASYDVRKPAPIASAETKAPGLWKTIGVRAGGGMVTPLLAAGTPVGTTKAYYLRPRFADQTTGDITLFAGDSPYLENNQLWERYLISGIPAGGTDRRVKLEFTVGADGKLTKPKATELSTQQELKVQDYSPARAGRLAEPARPAETSTVRRLPAAL
jgi:molecular chaperone DnaK (HSP70)